MLTPALQHAKEALVALDTEKILTAYHDVFVFEDLPGSRRITDQATLRAYFQALFALPGVAFTDIAVYEAPAFAAIEWTWSGVTRSSRTPYRVKGASLIELRDGKITRETLYYDPRPALA